MSSEVKSALIAFVGVVISTLISCNLPYRIYVKNQIFDMKKEALLSALTVMDDYLSWLDYYDSNDNRFPNPMRRDITPLELTMRARESYNKLCVTCDNSALLSSFLEIIFGERRNVCEEYNKFRAAARKELGLSSFEFDSNRVFLSLVSTSNLSNAGRDKQSEGQPNCFVK